MGRDIDVAEMRFVAEALLSPGTSDALISMCLTLSSLDFISNILVTGNFLVASFTANNDTHS